MAHRRQTTNAKPGNYKRTSRDTNINLLRGVSSFLDGFSVSEGEQVRNESILVRKVVTSRFRLHLEVQSQIAELGTHNSPGSNSLRDSFSRRNDSV